VGAKPDEIDDCRGGECTPGYPSAAHTKSDATPTVYEESAEREFDFAQLRGRMLGGKPLKRNAGPAPRVCCPTGNSARVFKLLRDDVLQIRHRTVMLGHDQATKQPLKVVARNRGGMYRLGTLDFRSFQ
jgi:hypothetical protein